MIRCPKLLRAVITASAFSCACFAESPSGPSTTPHPMTLDDADRLAGVGKPRLSPDGKLIVYTLSSVNSSLDKRIADLWMIGSDGGENIRLTYNTESSVSEPRWSPDGKYISFLSGRPGAPKVKGSQVWVLDRRGGEAQQLTALKGQLSAYEWSPDAKKLLLTIAEDPEAEVKEKETAEEKTKDKPEPVVIDRYHFKKDIEGYLSTNSRPGLLYLYDVNSQKLEKLTNSSKFDEGDAVWSPDGTQVAFVSNHDVDPDRTINTDIFVVPAAPNSTPRQLTTFEGPDEGGPAWSPDSKLIAYIQGSEPKYEEYSRRRLAIVSASSGDPRLLTAKFDRPVGEPVFSADGQSIQVLVADDRSQYPAAVSLADGSVKRLVDTPGSAFAQEMVAGRTVLLWTTDEAPPAISTLEAGKVHQLTTHNDSLLAQLKLGETRDFRAKTADGTDVHALLTLPVGYEAGKKYPLLLRIHGGPNGQDDHAFTVERQLFAGRGYAVLNVNYRGSSGRDTAYQQAIFAAWGQKEVVDLLACVDEAVRQGIADSERLGIGGWSYGGILTDYTIATTTRFKAAISGAGMGNPFGFYGVDMYIHQYDAELGPPWKNPEAYIKLGYPFLHADRIKTPTLFMGGDKDFNVPLNGSEQMYQALRSLNIPTELVIYPGQFHAFTRPSFIRDRYQRYFDWYDKYLMGTTAAK